MNIKHFRPTISVLELFGILFPGSIATLIIYNMLNTDLVNAFFTVGETLNLFLFGLMFLLASYFFGHLIFQLGSYLDGLIYDKFKVHLFTSKYVLDVKSIRMSRYGHSARELSYIDTFTWSLDLLRAKGFQHAAVEVENQMADSKLFRAVFIISIFSLIIFQIMNWSCFLPIICLMIISWMFLFLFQLEKMGEMTRKLFQETLILSFLVMLIISVVHAYVDSDTKYLDDVLFNHNSIVVITHALVIISSLYFYLKIRHKSTETAYRHVVFWHYYKDPIE